MFQDFYTKLFKRNNTLLYFMNSITYQNIKYKTDFHINYLINHYN